MKNYCLFSQSVSMTQYVVLSVCLSACLPICLYVPVSSWRGFVDNTIVTEASQEANWNRQTGGQAGRRTGLRIESC